MVVTVRVRQSGGCVVWDGGAGRVLAGKTSTHPLHMLQVSCSKKAILIPPKSSRIDMQPESDAAFPEPTLEFARLCLRNTLILLPENVSTTSLTDEQEVSGE